MLVREYSDVFVDDPDATTVYRDAIIDDRFLGLIDFVGAYSYGGQPGQIPTGTPIRDLQYDAPPSIALTPITKAINGIALNRGVERIGLGANWRLPVGVTHFAMGWWLDLDTTGYGTSGTADVPYSIAGYKREAGGTSTSYQWLVNVFAARPAGTLKTLQFQGNGKTVNTPYPAAGLHALHFEYQVVGANHLCRLYIDGALVVTSSSTAQGYVNPDASDFPAIGQFTSSFPNTVKGLIKRCWLTRLDQPGDALGVIIAKDMLNLARLS